MLFRSKPLITFAVFAFNQEKYIGEAIEAAFAQTYSPLEIILSDDRSTDETWPIVQQMAAAYKGPHRIVINQNCENLGVGSHVNAVVSLATGELVVGAAGDDISHASRTARVYEAWEQSGCKAMSIVCHVKKIDMQGRHIGEIRCSINPESRKLAHRARYGCWSVPGCSHAWHRKVFETFGPLQNYVIAEDRAIEFRSLSIGEVVFVNDYLVQYRVHGANLAAIQAGASKEEWARGWANVNRMHYAMYRQFLVDLDRIEELEIYPLREIRGARRAIVHNLEHLLMEKEFLNAPRGRQLLLGLKAILASEKKAGLKWILRALNLR